MCRREMVDAMQESQKYNIAFTIGWMYSYVLTVPHSVAVNLAYPKEIVYNGEYVDWAEYKRKSA